MIVRDVQHTEKLLAIFLQDISKKPAITDSDNAAV